MTTMNNEQWRERMARVLAELRGDELLNDQQCAKFMRLDLVQWRELQHQICAGGMDWTEPYSDEPLKQFNDDAAQPIAAPAGMGLVPTEATDRIKRAIFVMLSTADDEAQFYKKLIEMAMKESQVTQPAPQAQPFDGLDPDNTIDPTDLIGQFANAFLAWNKSPYENEKREKYRNALSALYTKMKGTP